MNAARDTGLSGLNVNPCGRAQIVNRRGRVLAHCLDTPNSIAAAFFLCPQGTRVVSGFPFHRNEPRSRYASRLLWIERDLESHRPNITFP